MPSETLTLTRTRVITEEVFVLDGGQGRPDVLMEDRHEREGAWTLQVSSDQALPPEMSDLYVRHMDEIEALKARVPADACRVLPTPAEPVRIGEHIILGAD